MSAKDFIEKYIDENASVFTDTSDKIWENPELSLKEFSSAALYCELLKKGGFEVTEELGGIKTAFCGKFGKGKPVIGILGEYDALSGLSQKGGATEHIELVPGGAGHGCGHNLLGAGSLGAAFAVKAYLEESGAPGTVIYFGCPGEEGGAGKAYLAREGLWKMLDAAITWHPSDINEIPSGTNNSCIQVLYKFKGLASHACSAYSGRSALDAVELMNVGVQFLREHMTPDCYIHYAITDAGGASPNVVQPTASVLYMVRANRVKDSIKLQKRVDKIAEGAALMTETSYDRTFIDGTADLLPNYTLEELLHESLSEFGVPEYTDEEMEYAKKGICSDLKSMQDSQTAMESYTITNILDGWTVTPEEYTELVKAVTKEDVMAIANSTVCDLIYFLRGEEGAAEETDEDFENEEDSCRS